MTKHSGQQNKDQATSVAEDWSGKMHKRFVPDPGVVPIGKTLAMARRIQKKAGPHGLTRSLFQRYGNRRQSRAGASGDLPFLNPVRSHKEPVPVVQGAYRDRPVVKNTTAVPVSEHPKVAAKPAVLKDLVHSSSTQAKPQATKSAMDTVNEPVLPRSVSFAKQMNQGKRSLVQRMLDRSEGAVGLIKSPVKPAGGAKAPTPVVQAKSDPGFNVPVEMASPSMSEKGHSTSVQPKSAHVSKTLMKTVTPARTESERSAPVQAKSQSGSVSTDRAISDSVQSKPLVNQQSDSDSRYRKSQAVHTPQGVGDAMVQKKEAQTRADTPMVKPLVRHKEASGTHQRPVSTQGPGFHDSPVRIQPVKQRGATASGMPPVQRKALVSHSLQRVQGKGPNKSFDTSPVQAKTSTAKTIPNGGTPDQMTSPPVASSSIQSPISPAIQKMSSGSANLPLASRNTGQTQEGKRTHDSSPVQMKEPDTDKTPVVQTQKVPVIQPGSPMPVQMKGEGTERSPVVQAAKGPVTQPGTPNIIRQAPLPGQKYHGSGNPPVMETVKKHGTQQPMDPWANAGQPRDTVSASVQAAKAPSAPPVSVVQAMSAGPAPWIRQTRISVPEIPAKASLAYEPLSMVWSKTTDTQRQSSQQPLVQRQSNEDASARQAPSMDAASQPSPQSLEPVSPLSMEGNSPAQLQEIAEQVYQMLMERLSIERESLGL